MLIAGLVAAAAPMMAGACFATAHPVAAGAVLAADDVEPVPCRESARPPLRYDRASGNPVALTALPAGTYLGRLAPLAEAMVPAGKVLTLRSSAGVVTIERDVTALQPGRSGGKLFVRDASGAVFAVPLVLGAE